MRIGTYIPDPRETPLVERDVIDVISDVEDAGFDSLWQPQNLGRANPMHDPLVALAAASSITTGEIGTSILQPALRHPVELADQIQSLYVISHQRLVLGVGTGSTRHDYELVGKDFDHRYALLSESIAAMRTLWDGGSYEGAQLSLWPETDGGPPILVGSLKSDRWITAAAEEYDGWITSVKNAGWQLAKEKIALFRSHGGKRAIASSITFDLSATTQSKSVTEINFGEALGPHDLKLAANAIRDIGYDDIVVRCVTTSKEELAAAVELLR